MSNDEKNLGLALEASLVTIFSAALKAFKNLSLENYRDEPLSDSPGTLRQLSGNFKGAETVIEVLSTIGQSGPIVPVPQHLIELTKIANRVVSFVLDGSVHFGTGMLVGPSCVLTAAHLFFDKHGKVIDPERLCRITIEAHTTQVGHSIVPGEVRKASLCRSTCDSWSVDPIVEGGVAQRDVDDYDFAIVRLDTALGNDPIGNGKRDWFKIPTVDEAEVLVTDLGVRLFQYLDRKELLTSSGYVRGVVDRGFRVLHTASTASSASGAAIVSDHDVLVAMHVSGSASNEYPKSNRGLPIRRVAEIIDAPGSSGDTIRKRLAT